MSTGTRGQECVEESKNNLLKKWQENVTGNSGSLGVQEILQISSGGRYPTKR